MKYEPKFKPGQRIVRRNPLLAPVCHEIFTIGSIDELRGRYIFKETDVCEYYVWEDIKDIDDFFIDADSLEGVWLRL